MNRLSTTHYAMIVYEERLARARNSGQGPNLQPLHKGLSALRSKLVAGGHAGRGKRWPALTARRSSAQ
jgi:hypothetical protein